MAVKFRNYTASIKRALTQLGIGTDSDDTWIPSDAGLLIANFDPNQPLGSTAVTAGTLYLMRWRPRVNLTISKLWWIATASASGAQNVLVGVYNGSGTLLSGSANVGAAFVLPTASVQTALSSSVSLTAGQVYYAALLSNMGSAQAQPGAFATNGLPDWQLANTAATLPFATNGTGLASLPGTLTLGSNSPTSARGIWVGGS